MILYGHAVPYIEGGYKYYGNGGYTLHLKAKYRVGEPIKLPVGKVTTDELYKQAHLYTVIGEYTRGGLFV